MRRLFAILLAPLALLFGGPTAAEPAAFSSDRITVQVQGVGPDVVLVPGLTSTPAIWADTVAAVPGYRYHMVQVGGFAGAPAGANADGPVVAPVAEEIARYIREAGLKDPALVGHSLGGTWVMMVAARNPGVASRVMVVDMVPFLGVFYGPPGTTVETVKPIAAQIRDALRNAGEAERKARVEATIATMVKTESLRAGPIQHSLTSDQAVGAQAMYDLLTLDLTPELPKIQVPLTVLWVRAPNVPITEQMLGGIYAAVYAPAPQAKVINIPDAWHFIMLDAPDRFRQELRSFLAGS
ncbi:MAG: hypothetical protein RLY86_4400 [Pseudomonadota bacterium]|jgi:pimeloyl-ACP methyl ester carboxylesterase